MQNDNQHPDNETSPEKKNEAPLPQEHEETLQESEENQTQTQEPSVDQARPDIDSVVNLSEAAQIKTPFEAVQAIILKPNKVFARVKNIGNWSWLPFLVVTILTSIPTWQYYSMIDFTWYNETMVDGLLGEVSPSEKAFAMQMMTTSVSQYVTGGILGLLLLNAIFALYLYKATQKDEMNVLSYTDWYGFTWWAILPVAYLSIISMIAISLFGHPESSPNLLAPFSLAMLFDVPMNSKWATLSQSLSLGSFWIIYLTAVGISQWTRLKARECYVIAFIPFIFIWTLLIIMSLS